MTTVIASLFSLTLYDKNYARFAGGALPAFTGNTLTLLEDTFQDSSAHHGGAA